MLYVTFLFHQCFSKMLNYLRLNKSVRYQSHSVLTVTKTSLLFVETHMSFYNNCCCRAFPVF